MAEKIPKHLKELPPDKNLYAVGESGALRIMKPQVAEKMKEQKVNVVKKAGKAK